MNTRLSCLLAMTLLTAACAVGPNYKKPSTEVPAAFKEAPPAGWKTAQPQDGVLRGKWWEAFGDPALNALEEQVAVSNQSLAQAEAQFRGARAAVVAARAGLFPTVTAGAQVTTSRGSTSRSSFGIADAAPRRSIRCRSISPGRPTCGGGCAATSKRTSPTPRRAPPTSRPCASAFRPSWRSTTSSSTASTSRGGCWTPPSPTTRRRSDHGQPARPGSGVGRRRGRVADAARNRAGAGDRSRRRARPVRARHRDPHRQGARRSDHRARRRSPCAPPVIPIGCPLRAAGAPARHRRRRAPGGRGQRADRRRHGGLLPEPGPERLGRLREHDAGHPVLAAEPLLVVRPRAPRHRLRRRPPAGGVAQAEANYDATVAAYRESVLTAFQSVEDNLAAVRILADEATQQNAATAAAERSLAITRNRYQAGIATYLEVITAENAAYAQPAQRRRPPRPPDDRQRQPDPRPGGRVDGGGVAGRRGGRGAVIDGSTSGSDILIPC